MKLTVLILAKIKHFSSKTMIMFRFNEGTIKNEKCVTKRKDYFLNKKSFWFLQKQTEGAELNDIDL